MRRVPGCLVLIFATAAPACGGDGSGGGGGGGLTSAEFGDQFCALWKPCCGPAGLPVSNQAACKALFGFAPIKSQQAAEDCLAEYQARAAAADFCDNVSAPEPEACRDAFPQNQSQPGDNLTGEACQSVSDCAPSANGDVACTSVGTSTSQVCVVRTHASAGSACSGSVEGSITWMDGTPAGAEAPFCYRSDGVFCDQGSCATIAAIDGACTTDRGCVDAAYCGGSVCKATLPAGSSCSDTSSACDDASYCEFTDQTCHARRAEGEACDSSQQCLTSYCGSEGTCKQFDPGVFGLVLFCS